jgi:hypothetical protein
MEQLTKREEIATRILVAMLQKGIPEWREEDMFIARAMDIADTFIKQLAIPPESENV